MLKLKTCNFEFYLNLENDILIKKLINLRPINMLFLNAAIFTTDHCYTEDNIETMFQVNYLAQFYLTRLLIKNLENTKDSRVIILSCESHR